MTDDLIARLRAPVPTIYDCRDAADALEAKDTRIALLEEELICWHETANWPEHSPRQLRARIAALEAALKPFVDRHIYKEMYGSDREIWVVTTEECQAARAAMEGKDD